MCNWRAWLLPGLFTVLVLTAIAIMARGAAIEQDITQRSAVTLGSDGAPWASLTLSGRDATINGVAPTEAAREAAIAAALRVWGVYKLDDSALTLLPLADPYALSLTRTADSITVSGSFPDAQTRTIVLDGLRAQAGSLSLVDETELARGAPSGFDALAGFAAAGLANLQSGVVTLTGSELSVQGLAPSVASYQAELVRLAAPVAGLGLGSVDLSLGTVTPYVLDAVETSDGIRLTGFAPSAEASAQIEAAAAQFGSVDSQLAVAGGEPEGFTAIATGALAQFGGLNNAAAMLTGDVLSLTGAASSDAGFAAASAYLASLPAGLSALEGSVTAPTITPYRWAAIARPGAVTLGGHVPDEATRAAILAAAAPLGTVSDDMRIGLGAPSGLGDAAVSLLAQMTSLGNASASIVDDAIFLAGEADTATSYDSVNGYLGGIPQGFGSIRGRIAPPVANPFETLITRDANGVTITGVLPSETARAVMLDAMAQAGLLVDDQTSIARGASDGFDYGSVLSGLAPVLVDLSQAQGSLRGNLLSLIGTSLAFEGAQLAEEAVTALAGGSLGVFADITPGPVSPYTFAASTQGAGITLEGFVPSQDERQTILGDIAALFPATTIIDNLNVAGGAPDDFAGMVRGGLRALGRLDGGRFALADRQANLSGQALYQRSVEQIEGGLDAAAPGEFTVATQISLLPPPVVVNNVECQLLFARMLADNAIRFATGNAEIDEVSLGLLDRLVRTLQSCPDARVEIGGHTDAQGGDAANQALSESRAQAIRTYVLDAGIDGGRVTAVGYGEADPIASNDTEEGRARNRRIEFTVLRDL